MLGQIRSREKVPQSWDDEVGMNTLEAHVGHCAKHELHCDSKADYSLSLTHAPLTSSLKRSILPAPTNALSSHPMSIFSLLLLLKTLLLAPQLWLLLQMIFPQLQSSCLSRLFRICFAQISVYLSPQQNHKCLR